MRAPTGLSINTRGTCAGRACRLACKEDMMTQRSPTVTGMCGCGKIGSWFEDGHWGTLVTGYIDSCHDVQKWRVSNNLQMTSTLIPCVIWDLRKIFHRNDTEKGAGLTTAEKTLLHPVRGTIAPVACCPWAQHNGGAGMCEMCCWRPGTHSVSGETKHIHPTLEGGKERPLPTVTGEPWFLLPSNGTKELSPPNPKYQWGGGEEIWTWIPISEGWGCTPPLP